MSEIYCALLGRIGMEGGQHGGSVKSKSIKYSLGPYLISDLMGHPAHKLRKQGDNSRDFKNLGLKLGPLFEAHSIFEHLGHVIFLI